MIYTNYFQIFVKIERCSVGYFTYNIYVKYHGVTYIDINKSKLQFHHTEKYQLE
jgi:hypothetical protein